MKTRIVVPMGACVLTTWMLAAGCNAPSLSREQTSNANAPTSAEQQFYGDLARLYCHAEQRCCTANGEVPGACSDVPAKTLPGAYSTDWASLGQHFVEGEGPACLAAVEKRLEDDAHYCDRGLAQTHAESIGAAFDLNDLCPQLYSGGSYHQTPSGEPCLHSDGNQQAADDARCKPADGGSPLCVTWTTSTTGGGSASWDACVTFIEVGGLGDACATASDLTPYRRSMRKVSTSPADTWRVTTQCGDGLRCLSGLCAPRAKVDESCFSIDDCNVGLVCDYGLHVCATPPTPAKIGESCNAHPCVPEAFCGTGMICTARVAHGEACTTSYDTCQAGLRCRGLRCLYPPQAIGPGEPCDDVEYVCAGRNTCDPTTQLCTPQGGAGAARLGGRQCLSAQCRDGKCTAPPVTPPYDPTMSPHGCAT